MSQDRIDKLEDMIYKTSQQHQELVVEVRSLINKLDLQSGDVKELKDDVKIAEARIHQLEIELATIKQQIESNKTTRNIIVGGIVTFLATIGAIAYQASVIAPAG